MPSIICVRRALIGLGIAEVLVGIGVAICGGVSIAVKSRYYKLFHGFWGGGTYMIIGLFGILAGFKKSKCYEMAHMVTAILGCTLLYLILQSIWASEIAYDGFASYYSDPPLCQDGCDYDKPYGYDLEQSPEQQDQPAVWNENRMIDGGWNDKGRLFENQSISYCNVLCITACAIQMRGAFLMGS